MRAFLFVCAIATWALTWGSAPMVASDGVFKAKEVNKMISSSKMGHSDTACPVVSIINLSGSIKSCDAINMIAGTSFQGKDSTDAINLDVTDKSAFLLATYSEMYSSQFCGAKAADFCGSVSDAVIVVLPSAELEEIIIGHDQTIRRIVNKTKGRLEVSSQSVHSILFVVEQESESSSAVNLRNISEKFKEIWQDGEPQREISCNFISLVSGNEDSVKAAKAAVVTLSSTQSGGVESSWSSLADKLSSAWSAASPGGVPQALLTPAQRQGMYVVEKAYIAGLAQCEATFAQWRNRAGSGKLVGKFGSRVQTLLDEVERRFATATEGSVAVRLKASRLQQLIDLVDTAAQGLFRQQLVILQTELTANYRNMLTRLVVAQNVATNSDVAEGVINREEAQQAMRQVLFDYRNKAVELEIESLGITSQAGQAEFSQALETLTKEFPESSYGRLEQLKKVEKLAKKQSVGGGGKRGGKAVNVGLNLVGMLRPPGYGNLQGFVGYSTALLGLPLELLMGVHNDGDSPEVMGEDREFPILRLQPKMHFDVDL